MRSRSVLVAMLAVTGCSRASETPTPKVVAEPSRDAAMEASVPDAGIRAKAPPSSRSELTIVARAPTGLPAETARSVGRSIALMQRLPGGGVVVASEFARARADGPGALSVELIGGGMDSDVLYRPPVIMGIAAMRWVWSDAALSIVVAEEETGRSGPRITSYKVGANGFQVLRPTTPIAWPRSP